MTAAPAGGAARIPRPAARILLLDPAGRVLLFRFDPAGRPPFWCTPGGAVDPGEDHAAAAVRELLEETGIAIDDPGPEVARKVADFTTLEDVPVRSDERYFLIRTATTAIDTSRHTPLERRVMRSWRWFAPADLAAERELVFPADLAAMLAAFA